MIKKNPVDDICCKLKLRNTKLRMAIGHFLHHSTTPVSVAQITSFLKEKGIVVNKTTIYRELNLLVKNEVIVELQLDSNFKRYEFNTSNKNSYLICSSCGSITPIEINRQILDKELDDQTKKHNFIINRHSLVFFGQCHKCH